MTREELYNYTKQAKFELDKAINNNFGYVGSDKAARFLFDRYSDLLEQLKEKDIDVYNLFINTYGT